jgi:uncharacterized protein with WD repeat
MGKNIRTFNELGKEYYTPSRVVFSPDGRSAFVGDDSRIFAWELDTARKLRMLVSADLSHVESLAVSPNGKYLVAGDIWGHIERWQVGSGFEGVAFVPKSDSDDGVSYK